MRHPQCAGTREQDRSASRGEPDLGAVAQAGRWCRGLRVEVGQWLAGGSLAGPVVDAGVAEGDDRAADGERRVHGPVRLRAGFQQLLAEPHFAFEHFEQRVRQVGADAHPRRREPVFAQHDVGTAAVAVGFGGEHAGHASGERCAGTALRAFENTQFECVQSVER